MAKDADNMALWAQVCDTDENFTKRVNRHGGFTAVDAQYQLKTATALWGPYGAAWGLRSLVWGSVAVQGEVAEITLEAEFFYPDGAFPISNDLQYGVGGECRKKLLTNTRSKALSTLGFNSDIYEGKFDGDRYVDGPEPEGKAAVQERVKQVFTPKPPAEPGAAPKYPPSEPLGDATEGDRISTPKAGRLWAIGKEAGLDASGIGVVCSEVAGTINYRHVHWKNYDQVIAALQARGRDYSVKGGRDEDSG